MKLVILDRDGTINQDSDQYIKSPAEWKPIPGSLQAIARLNQGGWRIVVATNQSGIARGLFDMADAERDPRRDASRGRPGRRPHRRDFLLPARGGFRLRVPQAQARPAARDRLPHGRRALPGVPMVGDSLRDLEAAAAAGAKPYLVLTGKGKKTRDAGGLPPGTQVFADLGAVAARLAP